VTKVVANEKRKKIKIKNTKVISGDLNVAANNGHQRRLYGVAADEGSLVAANEKRKN
jgi:hypothetical protein